MAGEVSERYCEGQGICAQDSEKGGWYEQTCMTVCSWLMIRSPVIKLKQVEHVRNERRTLADVTDHPFITKLVASFTDYQSLYMLVCLELLQPLTIWLLTDTSQAGLLPWG